MSYTVRAATLTAVRASISTPVGAVVVTSALKAVRQLSFLYGPDTGRTIGQAAILFSLARPSVKTVLPNITSEENLKEFAQAVDCPPLTAEEMAKIEELWVGGLNKLLEQPIANS